MTMAPLSSYLFQASPAQSVCFWASAFAMLPLALKRDESGLAAEIFDKVFEADLFEMELWLDSRS